MILRQRSNRLFLHALQACVKTFTFRAVEPREGLAQGRELRECDDQRRRENGQRIGGLGVARSEWTRRRDRGDAEADP